MANNEFGNTLRQLRIARGITERQLAQKVGVSVSYISKIENGVCAAPSVKTIIKISSTLKTDAAELINLAGKIPYKVWVESRERALKSFGSKLKELREKSGMSQLELAKRIYIDPSYISKLEKGTMPPPSQKILLRLAKVFKVSKNDLFSISGKVPNVVTREKGVGQILSGIYRLIEKNVSVPNLSIFMNKGWVRVAISVLLVVSIAGALWLASPSPVEAVTVSFPSTPAGTQSSSHTFKVRVDIQGATDLLPVQTIDIWVKDQTGAYSFTLAGVPLTATTKYYSPSGVGTVSVKATPASTWAYATSGGTAHYGYGYGYSTGTWGTETLGSGYGYGYAGGVPGDTYIIFTVIWTPPASWPTGTYNTNAIVYGNGGIAKAFTGQTPGSFTISAAAAPPAPTPTPGGGGPGPATIGEDIRDVTTSQGVFTEDFTLKSENEDLVLSIPKGTTAKTKDGKPLPSISIEQDISPPPAPEGKAFVGFPFDLEPDGATFDPPITITFTFDPNKLPKGVGIKSLGIGYYDWDTKKWVELDAKDVTIDPANNTITAKISGFSYYVVWVSTMSAEFTISDLVISPSSVNIAEEATIRAVITNSGDVSDTAKVTLKLNGVVVASKDVKVAGLDSETVSFISVQGQSGSYKVDIDGLTGTFTVKPATVGPVVIESTVPSITAPAVEYPVPTAPAPPAPPAPVPPPTPWLAIILSIVVTVIIASILVWYFGFRSEYYY